MSFLWFLFLKLAINELILKIKLMFCRKINAVKNNLVTLHLK